MENDVSSSPCEGKAGSETAVSTPGEAALFPNGVQKPYPPLMRTTATRRLSSCIFLFLLLAQLGYLIRVGNGLPPPSLGDTHSEADLLRSSEAYIKDGLSSHWGLPRILHGDMFPTNGTLIDHIGQDGLVPATFRKGFPGSSADPDQWVYTHYPPGPNLLAGTMAHLFGLNHIWFLRLLPISVGLLSLAVFFRTLARTFGTDRAAVITGACVVLPMVTLYMPGLHFQGYSVALLMLQLSFLIQLFWRSEGVRPWHWAVLFVLGFLQGWLSFDLFFIVSLGAVPLWLMRRTEGVAPNTRWLCLAVGLPLSGFALAHVLHFLQVVAELGGLQPAFHEFRHTAGERGGSGGYFAYLAKSLRLYLREFLRLHSYQFGPFMLLAIASAMPVALFRSTRIILTPPLQRGPMSFALAWPGKTSVRMALVAALLLCLVWVMVMPQHVVGNSHITLRQFFFFYFMLVLAVVRSLHREKEQP